MNLERECAVTPVCGVRCDRCPAWNPQSSPVPCEVMSAVIRAFQAQEDYWKRRIEIESEAV